MSDDSCKKQKTDPAAPESCQVCGEPLSTAPVVLCRKCSTPHHRECWRYNRGCSVYGCASRTFTAPSPALAEGKTAAFTAMQPTSNMTFGILLTFAIFALLGAIGITSFLNSPIPLIFGVPAYIIALLGSIFYKQGHYLLSFDPEKGTVERQLIFWGRRLFEADRNWLSAGEIVEVHLHKYMDLQFGPMEEVHVALQDGSRRLIQWTRPMNRKFPSIVGQADMDDLAERVADFADTTVRLIESQLPPSEEEIKLAADERKAVEGDTSHLLEE